MPSSAHCPRCTAELREADDAWACERHGVVEPLGAPLAYGPATLAELLAATAAGTAPVPLWLPWPMPTDWAVTGLRWAGHRDVAAIAAGCSGPGVLGGVGELLVVAERPGVGLGARYAGRPEAEPEPGIDARPADARVVAGGHLTPLWSVPVAMPDRTVYVGEAAGLWLWIVARPDTEWLRVLADLALTDVTDPAFGHQVPVAAPAGLVLE